MGRDTVQLETAVNTIFQEYLLDFTSEYDIPEALHPELHGPEDKIVDFPEGKVGGGYHLVRGRGSIPPMLYQALGLSQKLEQPLLLGGRESVPDRRGLVNECSQRRDAGGKHVFRRSREGTGYALYPHSETAGDATLLNMDLFNLIRAPNPTKVKIGNRPRAAHEVRLLTLTANRVIEMEDPAAATDLSGVPSTIERSPLDFANEAGASDYGTVALEVSPPEDVPAASAPEAGQAKELAATDPSVATKSRKRGCDRADVNAPPKVLRRDHVDPRPTWDPLSFADPQSRHPSDIAQSSQGTTAAGDPESGNASFAFAVGSPESIYRPEWGVANGSMLDTPEACQDLVDHVAPLRYFSELCHLHNDDFLRQYNVNLARQVAMGSQLRLRFEQEAKLLRKFVAQVAHRYKRIQARELEIKNLEALLEAEADMKKAAEDKSARLSQELKDTRALFSDLLYEDSRVEQRCAKMDARLDALSIDFDEELYPHMLIAIACRRWVIGRGLRFAVMKCGESLELRQAFADVVSAWIAKGMSDGLRHGALKDLKFLLVDQLEGLKDAPMAALYLESDTGDDAPQQIRDLRPSSSQLTIPVYPEVRDPMNPWAYKEEMLLTDAIAANISRAENKKKCRIVCRTHGVGSAHHARSDGVPVPVPTVVPQGLAILLADAATQTEPKEAT
uniref:Transposase (Putative), gypsy type n=1 Tax=Tanacetum cinerariifolium TaxID=118510 RepID=A0A6L2KG04_TANCI|nr:hypothetical protein [Tanacetum cinerariifolium]